MIVKVCGMRDGENIRQVVGLGVQWIGMIFWEKSPRNVTMIPTHAGIIPDRAPAPLSIPEQSSPTRSLSPEGDASACGQGREATSGAVRGASYVGVFVDEMPQNIITRVVSFQLDLIQLHGHESPTLIRNLRATLDPDIRPGVKIIKAINVASREDIAAYKAYEDCVDYFLFDTKALSPSPAASAAAAAHGSDAPLHGGSGKQFDWSILDAYDGNKPFLLSGGIGPDDAARVRAFFSARDSSAAAKCVGIDLNSRFETEPGMKDVEALRRFLAAL